MKWRRRVPEEPKKLEDKSKKGSPNFKKLEAGSKKSSPKIAKLEARIKKSSRGNRKPEEWTFYRKTEILGLLRVLVVLAFVIQLMVEFGPHTVAP